MTPTSLYTLTSANLEVKVPDITISFLMPAARENLNNNPKYANIMKKNYNQLLRSIKK